MDTQPPEKIQPKGPSALDRFLNLVSGFAKPVTDSENVYDMNGFPFSELNSCLVFDNDEKWIEESALTFRAFYLGMIKLADALTTLGVLPKENGIGYYLDRQGFVKGLWNRRADDTFKSTSLGNLLEQLTQSRPENILENFTNSLSMLDRVCTRHQITVIEEVRRVKELTTFLSSVKRGLDGSRPRQSSDEQSETLTWIDGEALEWERLERRWYDAMKELEHRLRLISLLETSHSLDERFKFKD
jgi:hypothetical protein